MDPQYGLLAVRGRGQTGIRRTADKLQAELVEAEIPQALPSMLARSWLRDQRRAANGNWPFWLRGLDRSFRQLRS
ncbi:hypothetical protein BDS110ZK4_83870 [Bradyrhizobium diazoefficiens]|nr:hypothetical protein BJA01nite_72730 [Bradyrhizobium japonicum]GMO91390.1 hypothetical protein BwSF19_69200 [Bradyrhizobium ottawaense]